MPKRSSEKIELQQFDLDPERGFLPARDPLQRLPSRYDPWEAIAAELGPLMLTGRLAGELARLPVLDARELESGAELRRAMLLLSYLGHASVWGGPEPVAKIARSVAIPWCHVAARLGRPPVLSYASYALDNWRRFDLRGSLTLDNVALLQNFAGGADEDWFIGVHIEIEYRAAPLLREVGSLLAAVQRGDVGKIVEGLEVFASVLQALVEVLRRMPEHCDPHAYYLRVRPYIHGWRDHPALPGGVVYEGVEAFAGEGQRFRGETGAQSGIIPTVDAVLGIEHAEDGLRAYLREMRDYMPPAHRGFLEAVEAQSQLRTCLKRGAASGSAEAKELYDECLHWLEAFRSTHLEFAASYIQRQSQREAGNPTGVGTGGTPFMPYLRKHRDETARHRLSEKAK
ncbi:MAG: hypothetical protein HKP27_12965 [Myxococcales bacterium]|nr:hypothetical protein [Myxococcales bacterium]